MSLIPYLDVPGFTLRTVMPSPDVTTITSLFPGWIEQQIEDVSSWINSQARKRYGKAANIGNSLPFGQQPPALVAIGTTPPGVALVGRPALGSLKILIKITTPGPIGTAIASWSPDGGITTNTGLVTSALAPLPGTGMSAVFSNLLPYAADNQYGAATPVPGTVLRWLTWIVTLAAYDKRGRNPQDPTLVTVQTRHDQAVKEIAEMADGTGGLWDLPVSEDLDSAVTTGGPLGYSEQSPYTWMRKQAWAASREDGNWGGHGFP